VEFDSLFVLRHSKDFFKTRRQELPMRSVSRPPKLLPDRGKLLPIVNVGIVNGWRKQLAMP
jgi:hypothetical protein